MAVKIKHVDCAKNTFYIINSRPKLVHLKCNQVIIGDQKQCPNFNEKGKSFMRFLEIQRQLQGE
jgi:hypothetical protein